MKIAVDANPTGENIRSVVWKEFGKATPLRQEPPEGPQRDTWEVVVKVARGKVDRVTDQRIGRLRGGADLLE